MRASDVVRFVGMMAAIVPASCSTSSAGVPAGVLDRVCAQLTLEGEISSSTTLLHYDTTSKFQYVLALMQAHEPIASPDDLTSMMQVETRVEQQLNTVPLPAPLSAGCQWRRIAPDQRNLHFDDPLVEVSSVVSIDTPGGAQRGAFVRSTLGGRQAGSYYWVTSAPSTPIVRLDVSESP
jgi:hypothetical protein